MDVQNGPAYVSRGEGFAPFGADAQKREREKRERKERETDARALVVIGTLMPHFRRVVRGVGWGIVPEGG